MSIRPLDMQVLIPKASEIAHQKHLQNQKHTFEQAFNTNEMNKQIKEQNDKIVKSKNNDKTDTNHDSKEESKQKYHLNQQNEKDNKNKSKITNEISELKIDIRI